MAAALVITGCKSQDPYDSQNPNNDPQILYPVTESGSSSFVKTLANPDEVLIDSCIATPSDYVTINWYLDGDLVNTGKHIEKSFPAGEYELRIEAVTTVGKKTHRTGTVTVKPYKNDPYSAAKALERNVKPGADLVLNGSNLSDVKKVAFYPHLNATEPIIVVDKVTAKSATVTLTTPDIEEGTYFLRLVGSDGIEYGANHVKVYRRPVILDGYQFLTLGTECQLQGINLEQVTSVNVGGKDFSIASATDNTLGVIVSDLAEGSYTLTCQSATGAVDIITKEGTIQSHDVIVSKEHLLFFGPVEIDWNQDLCQVRRTKMKNIPLGATIKIYYTIPVAEYHQYRVLAGTSWSLDVPGGAQTDFKADTPNPLVFPYDQAFKDCMDSNGSMCVVGFGFTVQYITWADPE